jgi:hypothetical protein
MNSVAEIICEASLEADSAFDNFSEMKAYGKPLNSSVNYSSAYG